MNSSVFCGSRGIVGVNQQIPCSCRGVITGQDWLFDLFEHKKVTDAKGRERRLLQGVSERSQEPSEGRAPGVDAVVAGKDLRVPPDEDRLSYEQVQEAAVGIGSHVRGKLAAQSVREIVDQRRIAEMVDALPVVAVGLKRKEAVGDENGCAAPDPQDAYDFGRGQTVVLYMLQDFMGQDQIESPFRIGELLTLAQVQRCAGHVSSSRLQMLTLDVHPVNFWDSVLQRPQVDAHAASVDQRALQRLRRRVKDHLQAPCLAGAPDE